MNQNYGTPQQAYTYQNVPPAVPQPPMKWHKFLVNFSLWLSAAGSLANAVYTGFGMHYGGESISRTVYRMYPSMQMVDIAYGFLLLTMAIFYIFTRFSLAKYKQNSPKMLLMAIVITFCLNLLYPLAAAGVTGLSLLEMLDIPTLAGNAVFFAINKVYYDKRKHLFVQ